MLSRRAFFLSAAFRNHRTTHLHLPRRNYWAPASYPMTDLQDARPGPMNSDLPKRSLSFSPGSNKTVRLRRSPGVQRTAQTGSAAQSGGTSQPRTEASKKGTQRDCGSEGNPSGKASFASSASGRTRKNCLPVPAESPPALRPSSKAEGQPSRRKPDTNPPVKGSRCRCGPAQHPARQGRTTKPRDSAREASSSSRTPD